MVKARVLDRYFRTEMTRDVDAILGLFTPEAVFQTPDRARRGREEIRPFYEDAVERFPGLKVSITRAFNDGLFEIAEWSAAMNDPEGSELALDGVNIARTDAEHMQIVEMRSYYDASAYGSP
jgi:ketosteroid isomerase-like protein